MCGRFVSATDGSDLAQRFGAVQLDVDVLGERYNVAPSQPVYAVREQEGNRVLDTLRWGFVPPWSQRLGGRTPINARIETVASSRMFRTSFQHRRCLIPADGFYEWQAVEGRLASGRPTQKRPWYITPSDDDLLAFAGIWTAWRDPHAVPDEPPLRSCAIVTTDATGMMADIHHRMPVMLPSRMWEQWLTTDDTAGRELHATVCSTAAPQLEAYEVTTRVNSPAHDDPTLLDPLPARSAGGPDDGGTRRGEGSWLTLPLNDVDGDAQDVGR